MRSMPNQSRGIILLEVLITIVILVVGLLGLAGFQVRATLAENESYQRAQALVLAQDMVDRIYANRVNAATYVQDDVGAAGTVTDCTGLLGEARDVCEWSNQLVGAGEAVSGVSVGTLLSGRGCIKQGAANEYFVVVVWRGFAPTAAPTAAPALACGLNAYGAPNEPLRRAVLMRIVISTLSTAT
jgi:type IV pilus assembly protein PilV